MVLTGTVVNEQAKLAAETGIHRIPGVTGVINNVAVQGRQESPRAERLEPPAA